MSEKEEEEKNAKLINQQTLQYFNQVILYYIDKLGL